MKHLLPLLLIPLALTACSPEATDGPGLAHVQVSISPKLFGTPASGWSDPAATDGEMMRRACVVVADANNKVAAIKHIAITTTESERENVDLATLAAGTYTFYNFGNLAPEAENAETEVTFNGLSFVVGQEVPAGAATSTTTAQFNNLDLASATTGLPMTNIEQHAISRDVTINLQLYRQMAKARIYLTNTATTPIQLTRVELGGITANGTGIYLFPQKDTQGSPLISWPAPDARTTTTVTCYNQPAAPLTIAAGAANAVLPDVYLNESQTDHATGRYPITAYINRLGADGTTWVPDTCRGLVQLTDLPRNAMLSVPITLTDYVLSLQAFFYPPIGGLPTFTMERHDNDFYATFKGAGDFVLVPRLYAAADKERPEAWFNLNDTGQVESYTLRVSDPSGIFSTAPHIDATTGEILGTLSGTAGRAYAMLTANIKVSPTQTLTYHRTVFFVAN